MIKLEYSNPTIPEGINTSPVHPLREFAVLTSGVLAAIVATILLLGLIAERLTTYIPFEYEYTLANQYTLEVQEKASGPTQVYLQSLASKLVNEMDLPAEMHITVHYIDNNTVNAFATVEQSNPERE